MNSKSHLLPETITDINGRTTTVYRKSGTVQDVTKTAIPAPVAAPLPLPFDRVAYIDELLLGGWDKYKSGDFSEQEIINKLFDLEDSTLLAIDLTYRLDSGDGETLDLIFDWVGYFAEEQEEYLRELLTYSCAFKHTTSPNFMEESLACLKAEGALPPSDDYSQVGTELQQTIRNLLSVAEMVFAERYDSMPPNTVYPALSPAMCKLVTSRPEDVERIKQIIAERQTEDAELVSSVLDSAAPAVSEGIL